MNGLWVVATLFVSALSSVLMAEEIPAEWGDIWQPRLPGRERHPYLFYGDEDKEGMVARLGRQPWGEWSQNLWKTALRSTPAVKWWLLGDEEAAAAAREDLIHRPIWRHKPQGYLEPSSHSFAEYVVAYDLLAAWPGLSDGDHSTIRGKIAAEADHYYNVFDSVPGGANYGNQRTLAASALGLAALTLCEHPGGEHTPAEWLNRALFNIRREENFWFFRPGGLFVEGLGYTNYMNVQFVPFAIAYERATGSYLFADPRLREWLTFAAYQMTGSGELIPWGTCETGSGLGFFALLSNQRYGRDLAPLFARAFTLSGHPYPHSHHLHIALAHYDPAMAETQPPAAARSFGQSQTAVLREDWGHETVSVWFAGKDGTWPLQYRYGTYSHGDAGHFMLVGWDEVLAADSGYDHWKSRDYYGAAFHNVVLIDGEGPAQDTPGEMSRIQTDGPVRHATVSTEYQGCTVRRTLALIRGRYVVVVDSIAADAEHEYAWQVRSSCPPGSPGTKLEGRAVTWPGLSPDGWRSLQIGRTQLTTVAPKFADLSLSDGRWRPISGKPEFLNQVALAKWRGESTTAMFALIPNLRAEPDVTWNALEGDGLRITGPDWADEIAIDGECLSIVSADGAIAQRLAL